MSLEFLQDIVEVFAIGPVTSRKAVRDAFAEMEISVPEWSVSVDAEPANESYTMLAYVVDGAGQASFLIYKDADMPERLGAALELMNGRVAASASDAGSSAEAFALARVVALNNSGLNIDEWVREDERTDSEAPDQAELDALASLEAADYFVVNDDGSVWKNGPKPPKDLLDRTYSRVVSFNLAL